MLHREDDLRARQGAAPNPNWRSRSSPAKDGSVGQGSDLMEKGKEMLQKTYGM
ncbi:hypothetical protein GCM10010261_21090 [Streptomyces pilosus]|nr:hypothetical protein GCM10010261_21090 [Streptomyces pilosus]